MSRHQIHGITLEFVRGDIVEQPDMDAIVNAANAQLRTGGGVAGAIHRAAGPELTRECAPLAPIQPGQAVITGAHQLPNRFVIHCLGPVYGVDKPSDKLLASCYRQALALAEKKQLSSLALPALSTGAFGYPMESAAQVALTALQDTAPTLQSLKFLRFVLFRDEDVALHERVFERLQASG